MSDEKSKDEFMKTFADICTYGQMPMNMEFENVRIQIIDEDGNRWAVANQIADAMKAERRSFRKLVKDLQSSGELKELRHFKYLSLPTRFGEKETLILSHRGVMRVCMRSNAPKAIPFRNWAEDVLFEVMVNGSYQTPGLKELQASIAAELAPLLEVHTVALTRLASRLAALEGTHEKYQSVAERELWERITPTFWAERIVKKQTWPCFNSGGRFDRFCVTESWRAVGVPCETRYPPMVGGNKKAEPVWPNVPSTHAFFETCFRAYINTPKQQRLKLVTERKVLTYCPKSETTK